MGRCSKFYPKSFADLTTIDAEGYISPCEAVWRIFAYPIHSRELVVQRLSFHLPGRDPILYKDGEDIDDIMSKSRIDQSMLIAWMDANNNLSLIDNELKTRCLYEIEMILQDNRKSLKEYPLMPFPECFTLFSSLTQEQQDVFEKIVEAVSEENGGVFFVYGHGGTGKTYFWIVLTSFLRSQGVIVLTVALSGIAALLLPGGRTAHSRFAIPLTVHENFVCNIKQNSELAKLLKQTKLIIWDEVSMVHRYSVEAVDKSLRDIMSSTDNNNANFPFGGKVVVFGGDFRQILPVIPGGGRTEIVNASICSSYIWDYCSVLILTKNMRLEDFSHADNDELALFSQWILNVGDGNIDGPNDGISEIMIPTELLISKFEDHLSFIVDCIYPNLFENHLDSNWLQ
ncbi:ATP-dependent DNA helicase PIF1-like [Arachis ipaensis]|uniref:ATP-dependent DNA helicase PIF1-like n=1 Tax=Arachis ipaensis TaxID=130454 RepID=UPI0007AF3302|nr:ATP-dependent DNA helicase PIF1-like [Arachis ipaensis]